jgi:hypothetical protein
VGVVVGAGGESAAVDEEGGEGCGGWDALEEVAVLVGLQATMELAYQMWALESERNLRFTTRRERIQINLQRLSQGSNFASPNFFGITIGRHAFVLVGKLQNGRNRTDPSSDILTVYLLRPQPGHNNACTASCKMARTW